ncbi:hypothetical protein HK096_010655, partial [Nowakowskiella sp. JEL0078]
DCTNPVRKPIRYVSPNTTTPTLLQSLPIATLDAPEANINPVEQNAKKITGIDINFNKKFSSEKFVHFEISKIDKDPKKSVNTHNMYPIDNHVPENHTSLNIYTNPPAVTIDEDLLPCVNPIDFEIDIIPIPVWVTAEY